MQSYYCDSDGDGFTGSIASGTCASYNCVPVLCTTTQGTDCDDTNPLLYPGQEWYEDGDGDGYSDGTILNSCSQPSNYYLSGDLLALTGDNCPAVANPTQIDGDGDGVGDACDPAECGNNYWEA
ncbi:MAG: hypothetical protein H6765_09905 [Candidatus Peribacteria bacterium]|nr:MAG: hypothetical protein H6765_09905 [Candidatus Peribacteria bacterium]